MVNALATPDVPINEPADNPFDDSTLTAVGDAVKSVSAVEADDVNAETPTRPPEDRAFAAVGAAVKPVTAVDVDAVKMKPANVAKLVTTRDCIQVLVRAAVDVIEDVVDDPKLLNQPTLAATPVATCPNAVIPEAACNPPLLKRLTTAVPALLMAATEPEVPINEPAESPPVLKRLTAAVPALLIAAPEPEAVNAETAAKPPEDSTPADADVKVVRTAPQSENIILTLDIETLTMFPTTYSPAVVLVAGKVIGCTKNPDHPP